MICSLLLDPEDSLDFPGNEGTALGRPLAAYPLMAAKAAAGVGRQFVVTKSHPVKSAAVQYGARLVDPPAADSVSPWAKSLLLHGWRVIKEDLQAEKTQPDLLVVLFAHAPAVTSALIEEGLEALKHDASLDSAVSVSPFNRWNPFNARSLAEDGTLSPYLPAQANDRGDAWFPNWGVQVLRPKSLDALDGPAPLPWLGKKVRALKQWGGGPIDYKWQIPAVEFWLKKHGYPDMTPRLEPQPKPQPQAKPAPDRR
jgi:hypothetical protein